MVVENPHTDKAVCHKSPEKPPPDKPAMIITSSDAVFNESSTVNAGRQEEPK
jgi:hypothetical protein